MHIKGLKWSIFLLVVFPFVAMSQSDESILRGLGIEAGAGHNSLYWSSPNNIRTIGGVAVDRTHLYVTPTVRMTYRKPLSGQLSILPFFGYSRFGGNSMDDTYYIDALEGGAFGLYRFSALSVGAGLKANYHLNGRYRYGSDERDRSSWFTTWSGDIGIRTTYSLSSISVSAEGWFGFTNLAGGLLPDATLTDNHFRLLVGYTL